jgi:hypothetical protein
MKYFECERSFTILIRVFKKFQIRKALERFFPLSHVTYQFSSIQQERLQNTKNILVSAQTLHRQVKKRNENVRTRNANTVKSVSVEWPTTWKQRRKQSTAQ